MSTFLHVLLTVQETLLDLGVGPERALVLPHDLRDREVVLLAKLEELVGRGKEVWREGAWCVCAVDRRVTGLLDQLGVAGRELRLDPAPIADTRDARLGLGLARCRCALALAATVTAIARLYVAIVQVLVDLRLLVDDETAADRIVLVCRQHVAVGVEDREDDAVRVCGKRVEVPCLLLARATPVSKLSTHQVLLEAKLDAFVGAIIHAEVNLPDSLDLIKHASQATDLD
jgi:hypothetical protein